MNENLRPTNFDLDASLAFLRRTVGARGRPDPLTLRLEIENQRKSACAFGLLVDHDFIVDSCIAEHATYI